MTRLGTTSFLTGAQLLVTDFEIESDLALTELGREITGGDGGQAGLVLPGGSAHLSVPVTEDCSLGLSLTAPFVSGLAYDPDWVGRYITREVLLLVPGVQPSAAYAVTDWLSIGAGLASSTRT
jgi:long-chain fatty acid transport protein